jgi:8-oxo-dGTP pyrophosphatase MutT (NUDIX family)
VEETGYRLRSIEPILTFQPMAGSADSAHELYLARGADRVGLPKDDEAEEIRWIPLAELSGPDRHHHRSSVRAANRRSAYSLTRLRLMQ